MYKHRGDQCPYITGHYNTSTASYVKYYPFEDWEDENGVWYEECTVCGYIGATARRMSTTDMEALPASILKQLADLSKTGVDEFFVRVDSKIFICYKNGGYYRIEYTDEPDADITPTVPPALLE